jgi:mannose-6-phosphate isomerase-like protein (cupin superfamily)
MSAEPTASAKDPRYTRTGLMHVPAGQGPTYWVSGDVYTLKSSRDTTDGALGFVEASVPPGGGPIAHIHTRADEAFYVLDGELEMLDGGRTFTARTGDFVFVPRGIRHRFKNTGVHVVRLLFFFMPGGDELAFEFGDEPKPGELPPPWGRERFATPELLAFLEDAGVEMLPEEDE